MKYAQWTTVGTVGAGEWQEIRKRLKHGIFMCSIVIMMFFAIFGGYVLTSVLFFKYPNFIHKRKQLKFKCRHISHRGGESVMVMNVNIAEHDMKTCIAPDHLKIAALRVLAM